MLSIYLFECLPCWKESRKTLQQIKERKQWGGKKRVILWLEKSTLEKTSWKIFLYGASQSNWWAPAVMSTGDQSTRSFWALATASTKWNTSVMWECLWMCVGEGAVLTSVRGEKYAFLSSAFMKSPIDCEVVSDLLWAARTKTRPLKGRINRWLRGFAFAVVSACWRSPFKHKEKNSTDLNQAGFHYQATDSQTEPPPPPPLHLAKWKSIYRDRKELLFRVE